jgi:hypothetical protein
MENPSPPASGDAGSKHELRGKLLLSIQRKAQNSFWSIVREKTPGVVWKHCVGLLPSTYNAEREVVMTHTTPFLLGLGCSMVILIGFRVTGTVEFQRFRHVHIFNNPGPPPIHEFLKEQQYRRPFAADLLFSVLFLGGAISAGFHPNEMKREVQDAPLLAGRSLISESMCKDLIDAHKKYPPEVFGRIESDNAVLDFFDDMVFSCKVRTRFETLVRRRNRWSEDHPVVIPEPGLFQLAAAYDEDDAVYEE